MKAVIPAAGLGTRFLPITKVQPKEMIPVYDKPTIHYVVEEVIASGIDSILIITGRNKRAIEDYFDRAPEIENAIRGYPEYKKVSKEFKELESIDIYYTRQKEQRGLGDAIRCARKYVGDEPFAVLLGDTITMSKVPCTKQLMRQYEKVNASVIAVESVLREKITNYGIVAIGKRMSDKLFVVDDLVEKPKVKHAPSDLGIIGRYVLTPEIFDALDRTAVGIDGEIQLTDALKFVEPVYAYLFNGMRYDIGNILDWLKATIELGLESKHREELEEYLNCLVKGFK